MANKIVANKKGGKVVIRCDSNNTMNVSSLAVGGETLTGLVITQIAWTGSNTWTIARGSNTIFTLPGNGQLNLAASGITLGEDGTANLTITNPQAAPAGTLLIEVKKY